LKKEFEIIPSMGNRKKELWKFPWGYAESFIIATVLLITGFLLEVATKGRVVIKPQWPYNLLVGLLFAGVLFLIDSLFKKHALVKWLSSIPACISSISLFSVLALMLGIIPQNGSGHGIINGSGIMHISRSWPFLLSQVYLLTTLGLVILRRALPLKGKNIGFLLNHFGLWLIITAALLGSGDLKRLRMALEEGSNPVQVALGEDLRLYLIPFSVKLVDFNIEEYNPKISVYNKKTGEYLTDSKNPDITFRKGLKSKILKWNITISEFYGSSGISAGIYEPSSVRGSAPAALICAVKRTAHDTVSGWITCGSYTIPPQNLDLDSIHTLVMKPPEARKFSSILEIYNNEINADTIEIEANSPVTIKGWKIYQAGYNDKMGKWSDISIIELVRDPWLPLVYSGIFLLLAGAVYIFWTGRKIRNKKL
jgi:hypothetical protein